MGNNNLRIKIDGAHEVIEKMDELNAHLVEVKLLIREINAMEIKLNFGDSEKPED